MSGSVSVDQIQEAQQPQPQPQHHDYLVKYVFLLLGIGFLLPWNAVVSASNYFENRININEKGHGCVQDDMNTLFWRQEGTMHMKVHVTENADNYIDIDIDADANADADADAEQSKTHGDKNFMLWYGLVYNTSGVITLTLMMLIMSQRKKSLKEQEPTLHADERHDHADTDASSDNHNHNSQWKRVVTSLSCFLLAMTLTTTLVLIPPTIVSPFMFQSISLLSASICGIAGAFIGADMVAFANEFPPKLGIQPFVAGQAVGGVAISVLNYVSFAMESTGAHLFWQDHCVTSNIELLVYYEMAAEAMDAHTLLQKVQRVFPLEHSTAIGAHSALSCDEAYSIDWGAFSYFLVSTLFLVVCIGLYMYLDQAEVTQYYRNINITQINMNMNTNMNMNQATDEQSVPSPTNGMMPINTNNGQAVSVIANMTTAIQEQDLREPLLNNITNDEENLEEINAAIEDEEGASVATFVWQCIQSPATSMFTVFLITLVAFPSWMTKLESTEQCQDQSSRLHNDLFVPALIVLFNTFDLIGRSTSGLVNMNQTETGRMSKSLAAASYLRIAFLPLFLLCKASGSASAWTFGSDWFPFIFTAFFAFTNGFVSTLCFVQGAAITPAGEEMQHISSTILNFALGLGCLSGSLLSFIYNLLGTMRW